MNICRSKDGFIKVHYRIQESDLWDDTNAFVVFLRMIRFAHYEDDFTSIRFNGGQRYLKRGEFAASITELSRLVNLPVGTLRDVLARLESDKRISKQTSNRTTVFRICNYSKYQDVPASSPASRAANKPANSPANKPASPTEGKKNIKNIKNIKNNSPTSFNSEYDRLHKFWDDNGGRKLQDNKTSRGAVKNLLKEHTVDEIEYAIKGAIYFQGREYKPQVMSFSSLYEKWDSLSGHMQSTIKGAKSASNRFE